VRIVADENMAAARAAFAGWGELLLRPGRTLTAADVAAADALFVRSVTRVDADLLAGSRVRFVGSATIGIDHVDSDWLREQGIGFAHAPGCNAAAVADWVVAALAAFTRDRRHRLGDGSAGIIGAGNVGSRVARRLHALGYEVMCCDPPRAAAEGDAGFVDLERALACDVVSLHVPLTTSEPCPTHHLLDAAALAMIPPDAVLLNAARGGVVDEAALCERLDRGPPLHVALDTWVGEPDIDLSVLERVALGSPHVAGHSLEGRLRGTAMIAAAAARHFGREHAWDWQRELPPGPGAVAGEDFVTAILHAHDPHRDDADLRALAHVDAQARGEAFDRLRRDYPLRREFSAWEVPPGRGWLRAAGFGGESGSGSSYGGAA